jgi:hypothetical protein
VPLLILPPAPSLGCETMPTTGWSHPAAGSGGAAHARDLAFPLGRRMTPGSAADWGEGTRGVGGLGGGRTGWRGGVGLIRN